MPLGIVLALFVSLVSQLGGEGYVETFFTIAKTTTKNPA